MKKKADALMLDELLRAHYKPLNLFTHEKFDTTDIRGFPFSDKKEKVKKMKKVKNNNRVRDGVLNISLHEDGVDEPLFEITKRVDGNWQVMRHIVGEYVSGKEYIVLTSNKTKETQK